MNRLLRYLQTICFLLAANSTFANEPIYLNYSDLPNRSVQAIDSSSMAVEIDLTGDDALIEQNRQRGVTFPLRLSHYRTYKMFTKTGKSRKDGSFKFERKLEDVASYAEDKNGNRIPVQDSMKDMVGIVINGVIASSGKMLVDGVEGEKIDSNKRALIKSIFASLSLPEEAPKKNR